MRTVNPLTTRRSGKGDITSRIQDIVHFIAANGIEGCKFIATTAEKSMLFMESHIWTLHCLLFKV